MGKGLLCKATPEYVGMDFCKFPTSGHISNARGTVQIWVKTLWDGTDTLHGNHRSFFSVGTGVMWGEKNTFHLQKEGQSLKFIVVDEKKNIVVVTAKNVFANWKAGEWHHIAVTWDVESGIGIFVDGFQEGFLPCKLVLGKFPEWMYVGNSHIKSNGESHYFPSDAIIDELRITDNVINDFSFTKSFPIKTVVWPSVWARGGKAFLLKGTPIHQHFYYYGNNKNLGKANLVIDIPRGIKLSGVYQACINNVYAEKPPVTSKEFMRAGLAYIRYTIPILNVQGLSSGLDLAFNHGLYFEPEKNLKVGEYPIYWHVTADQRIDEENKFTAVILPELPMLQKPQNFVIATFFYGSLVLPGTGGVFRYHASDDHIIGDKIRQTCRTVGIQFGDQYQKGGVGNFDISHAGWFHYGVNGRPWAQGKDVNKQRINLYGKPVDGLACPTYIIQKGIAVDPAIAKYVKRDYKNIRRLVVDFEIERAQQECFCQDCIKSFIRWSGLTNQNLTGNVILSKYDKEWEKFQCYLNAGIANVVCDIARTANPDVQIWFCSGCVYDEDFIRRTCQDVRLFDPFVSGHMPMMYFGGPTFYRLVEQTINSLKKPVMPFLVNTDHVRLAPLLLSPTEFRMNMLAAATSGAKGVGVYPGLEGFDGEFYTMLNRAMYEIAVVEDFFLKGTRNDKFIQTKWMSSAKIFHKVHSYNNEYLFSLFNYSKQETLLKISIPMCDAGKYTIYDPIRRELLVSHQTPYWSEKDLKNGIAIRIAPENVYFVILAKYNPDFKYKTFVSQSEINRGSIPAKILSIIPEISIEKVKIYSDDLDSNGVNEIRVTTPVHQVWIDYQGGAKVSGWQIKDKQILTHEDPLYNRLFLDLFYPQPGWGGEFDGAYEIVERKIEDSKVFVALRKQLHKDPLNGLIINKTYCITVDSPIITVKYSFQNLSKRKLNFSFWSHNVPSFNGQEWKVCVPTKRETSIIGERQKKDMVCTKFKDGYKENGFTDNWVAAYSVKTHEAFVFKFSNIDVYQLYSWFGFPVQTIEWMYNKKVLEPNDAWKTEISVSYLENVNEISDISKNAIGK